MGGPVEIHGIDPWMTSPCFQSSPVSSVQFKLRLRLRRGEGDKRLGVHETRVVPLQLACSCLDSLAATALDGVVICNLTLRMEQCYAVHHSG
jgi:hypothetical protein